MATSVRWTVADLDALPDDEGSRYEIIDGELYVAKQPSLEHQHACVVAAAALRNWDVQAGAGVTFFAPGLIFGVHEAVAPDLVWVSKERLATARGPDGKLHAAPELVVEVLSPGSTNEQRDRETKLDLYSRRGVDEYWIVDWQQRRVEVYRREAAALRLVAALYEQDLLQSPRLPGFALWVGELFL